MKNKLKSALILLAVTVLSSGFIMNTNAATFIGGGLSQSTASDRLGAFIIIAGDRTDHALKTMIQNDANRSYQILRALGFPTSKIYYLGPNTGPSQPYVNGTTTLTNIQWAIETWASDKVSSSRGLGLYIVDHGGSNFMCMGGIPSSGGSLTDTNLNTWLDNLEASTSCSRIIIIYEACDAGSFIDPVSKSNRIVVASTSSSLGAYVTEDAQHALFSQAFWSAILCGNTIGGSFEYGHFHVHEHGYGTIQDPMLDDNHDETGHGISGSGSTGTFPNGGDGSDALDTWIKYGAQIYISSIMYKVVALPFGVNASKGKIPIWARIENSTKLKRVSARFVPPAWNPPTFITDNEGSYPVVETGTGNIQLSDLDGDGNWTADFPLGGAFLWPNGTTKITITGESEDGNIIEQGTSCLVGDGSPPVDMENPTVSISDPFNNETVSGFINITAKGDDDVALDYVKILVDGNMVKNDSMPSIYPYPDVIHSLDTSGLANGNHNITAIAMDKTGKSAQVSITVDVQNSLAWYWIAIPAGAGIVVLAIAIQYARKKKRA
nr:C13 family peptidase [Candidatus Sigynarchaeota archaeon]